MADQRDCEGQELFISIEVVPLLGPAVTAMRIIRPLQNYLLGASNTMIGEIMASAFESISLPAWITLFWVHELQRIEVLLKDMLAQEPGAVTCGLIEGMQLKLVDYNDFVIFRESANTTS